MQPAIVPLDPGSELRIAEGCFIVEMSNSADDLVTPGGTRARAMDTAGA